MCPASPVPVTEAYAGTDINLLSTLTCMVSLSSMPRTLQGMKVQGCSVLSVKFLPGDLENLTWEPLKPSTSPMCLPNTCSTLALLESPWLHVGCFSPHFSAHSAWHPLLGGDPQSRCPLEPEPGPAAIHLGVFVTLALRPSPTGSTCRIHSLQSAGKTEREEVFKLQLKFHPWPQVTVG